MVAVLTKVEWMDDARGRLDKKLSQGQPGGTHRTEEDPFASVLTH